MVDINKGMLAYSPNLGWRNVPLRQMFMEHTGLPIFPDNDATAAALGEHLFGNARQIKDFLTVMVGIGIGCGLFLDGKLYRGTGGFAGEIGHTVLGVDVNRLCRCGHRGCWETYGNQYSLIERMRSRIDIGHRSLVSSMMAEGNYPLSIGIITRAAEAGDSVAQEVLAETGEAIGMGIANLIDIFNPKMVVLGGALSIAGPYLLPSIKNVVEGRALAEPYRQTELVLSKFGTDAAVMGAVGAVVKAILTNPMNTEFHGISG
jgi:predicted NBD/HSP70 family sugar kinase